MTIELEILVLAGAAIGLVCGGIGYWWASTNQRRAAGGKSVAELATEKQQYEAEVVEHFKASADLLNEMTDKYRDVYRHMAEGAQKLVPGDNVAPALAALQSGLLAAPGEPSREAILEPESEAEQDTLSDDVSESAEEIEPEINNMDVTSDDQATASTEPETATTSEPVEEVNAEQLADGVPQENGQESFFSSEPEMVTDESENDTSTSGENAEKTK